MTHLTEFPLINISTLFWGHLSFTHTSTFLVLGNMFPARTPTLVPCLIIQLQPSSTYYHPWFSYTSTCFPPWPTQWLRLSQLFFLECNLYTWKCINFSIPYWQMDPLMCPTSIPLDRMFSSMPKNPSELLPTFTTTVLSFVTLDFFRSF